MPVVGLTTVVIEALLVFQISVWTYAVSDIAQAHVADATVVQEEKQEQRNGNDVWGWIAVGVSPMTAAFAESLGMSEPYGAIFDQPERAALPPPRTLSRATCSPQSMLHR
jgi:hypothetical protein